MDAETAVDTKLNARVGNSAGRADLEMVEDFQHDNKANRPHALVHQPPAPRRKLVVATTATSMATWEKTVLCQISARITDKDSRPEL